MEDNVQLRRRLSRYEHVEERFDPSQVKSIGQRQFVFVPYMTPYVKRRRKELIAKEAPPIKRPKLEVGARSTGGGSNGEGSTTNFHTPPQPPIPSQQHEVHCTLVLSCCDMVLDASAPFAFSVVARTALQHRRNQCIIRSTSRSHLRTAVASYSSC